MLTYVEHLNTPPSAETYTQKQIVKAARTGQEGWLASVSEKKYQETTNCGQ